MTPDQLALTPRIITRILTFIVTLVIGVGLSQVLPLRFSQVDDVNAGVSPVKETKRRCPGYRR